MKSKPWSAMLAIVIAASAPSCAFAGILYAIGGPSNSSANISLASLPSLEFQNFLMPTDPALQADLSIGTGSPVHDGEARLVGGMYSDVEPLIGYIAIVDGSRMEMTPGESSLVSNSYGAGGQFTAIREMGYLPNWAVFQDPDPDGNLYLSSQFKATGWLAPGAVVTVASSAHVKVSIQTVASLGGSRSWSSPGAFELNYSDLVAFSGFNLNAPGGFALDYTLSVSISGGEEPSWVILDPGAGTGSDPSNLFPWLPAANPVPEPASWLLGLAGIASLRGLRRRATRRVA